MKKIILLILTLMLAIGRGAVGSAAAGTNVWYDPAFDFSTIKSIAVYPVYAPAFQQTSTAVYDAPTATLQYWMGKTEFNTRLTYIVEYHFENKDTPVFTENAVAAQTPVKYPALLEPFASEAERGEATHAATGADAYLLCRVVGPYEVQGKKSLGGPKYNDNFYACCNYSLHGADGRKILTMSGLTGVMKMDASLANEKNSKDIFESTGGMFICDANDVAAGLARALEQAKAGSEAYRAAAGGKTVRVGEIRINRPDTEAGGIMAQSLATRIIEKAIGTGFLHATTGDESDYLIQVDVTDYQTELNNVKMTFALKTKASMKATIRLVDARTGAVAATYQGESTGDCESDALGKLLKGFFSGIKLPPQA